MRCRGVSLILAALCACSPSAQAPLRLVVAAPLTGELSLGGQGMLRSVQMALADETANGDLPPIEIVPIDDKNNPQTAAEVAHQATSDPLVFAVIGHLTSGCSLSASRIYALSSLAMITPSATATALTTQQEQPDWRGDRVVFRLPPSDGMQGEFAADYAVKRLSLRRFVLIHDGTPYGQGLVDSFAEALKRKGFPPLAIAEMAHSGKNEENVISGLIAAKPEAVFFGGIYPAAGRLMKLARARGFRGQFMSGDAAKSPELFEYSGPAADGAYITMGGVPAESLPSAADFVERYLVLSKGVPPRTFDHYAYEATRIALAALRKTGKGDRKRILAAMRDINLRTMMGDVIFDSKGDTLKSLATMTKASYAQRKFEVVY